VSGEQSQKLNRPLPPELADRLRREQVDPGRAWLCTDSDLNLAGQYEQVFLLAEPERLVVAGGPSESFPGAIRMMLDRASIREMRTRQGVGGGFLEALVEGVYVEVLAYSNARAERFHRVNDKLRRWCAGERVRTGPEDDKDPRHCPQCGMPLLFEGDICRRCAKHASAMWRVLKMMWPYRARTIAMMVLVFAGIGVALVPQQLIRVLIDRVLAPGQANNPPLPPATAATWMLGLVAALFGVYLFGAVIAAVLGRLASFLGTQAVYDLRARIFGHLTRLGVDYYDRHSVGQLMTRVATDTQQVKTFIQQLTTGLLAQALTIVAVGVMLFFLNWKLALFALMPAPVVIVAATFFWKRIYPRYYRVYDANSKLNTALNAIFSGVRVVKAFGQEQRERDRFDGRAGYVRDSYRSIEYTVARFNPGLSLLFQSGSLLVWFVGGMWVLGGKLSLGQMMAFLFYLGLFYAPLRQLTQLTTWLTGFLTAAQRVFEIIDTPIQIKAAPRVVPVPHPTGEIVFENVTFGYERFQPVLKDVSFRIAPGEHVGMVGRSGSGKTTAINLILRFYDPDSGRVRIDGVDVREMDPGDHRRAVGVVLQQPFLFRGTIRANVAYGRTGATREEILAVARAANAHEFIMDRPLGYDTYIGDRGAGLSGGERQRISIARALLYDPKILILDEATSSVDTESEQKIQQALARVATGRTTIAIAHRLSTLKNADRILVLDDGRVVEEGSHEQLMELHGLYHRLVKIQTELSRDKGVAARLR